MVDIRYRFLDRSSGHSPFRHILAPAYTLCDKTTTNVPAGGCNGSMCLNADMEIEHRNNIDYEYWVNYALNQIGMTSNTPIIVDVDSARLFMTIFNRGTKSQHTWELPLVGDEMVFVTSVPASAYWRILFTFTFIDTMGNKYVGTAFDDFAQSPGDVWECQEYKFPNAYITFAGYSAPMDVQNGCPGQNCTIVPYQA